MNQPSSKSSKLTVSGATVGPSAQAPGITRRGHLRWIAATGVAAASSGLLAACGGSSSSSSGKAQVRLLNATLTHSSLDFLNAGAVLSGAVGTDKVSAYTSVASGGSTLAANDAGSTTSQFIQTPSLATNGHYTMVAYEAGGQVYGLFLGEDLVAPTAGTVLIRVVDLAVQAGRVDVYITSTAVANASALASLAVTGTITTFNSNSVLSYTYAPGTYYVSVTAAGNPADVRMLSMPITLASQQIGNVLLTPTSGGSLINGQMLIQQDVLTSFRNTNARVRVASAVSSNATVAATATSGGATTTIDAGSLSPSFGAYALVPAGASLNVTVNGTSIAAPSGALTAGSDSTLLVYGNPGAATATLLTDDNRPPSDSSQVKIRFINGIAGATTTTLSLTANSATVASGIAAGVAAPYASVAGSSNPMYFNLYSPSVSGIYYSNNTNVLNANSVYTVMAAGTFAAPFLLVR